MWRSKLKALEQLEVHQDNARGSYASDKLQTLVAFLDDDDPLIAFTAMQHLQEHMRARQLCAERMEQLVKLLLAQSPAAAQWTASSSFRFQLLRVLIETRNVDADADASSDSELDALSDSECPSATERRPGLTALLLHARLLAHVAHRILAPAALLASSVVVYELFGLLTAVVDQRIDMTCSVATSSLVNAQPYSAEALDDLVIALLDTFATTFDFTAQPTYVANAAVALMLRQLQLLRVSQQLTSTSSPNRQWLDQFTRVVTAAHDTSLTQTALALLVAHSIDTQTAQLAFVSPRSAFPFVQMWLALVSTVALTLAEHPNSSLWRSALDALTAIGVNRTVPIRATVLAVLSEQDDVMVDVLNTLLQLTFVLERDVESPRCDADKAATAQRSSPLSARAAALQELLLYELDPDRVFTDLVHTLGHDHLVVLDLLISSETAMLEYLLRYLRRLDANWSASRMALARHNADRHNDQLQQQQQQQSPLDALMTVLIRLRLEIDTQVAADMFPYNVAPLQRRLLRIETLYEEDAGAVDDDAHD